MVDTMFKKGQTPWNKGKKGWHSGKDNSFYGKKHSEVSRNKMSESHKGIIVGMSGKRHSEESKIKMSIALKGKIPWMKGKQHTNESILKMRESHKRVVAWNKGIPMRKESRKKLSQLMKGKPAWNKGKKTGKHSWNWGKHPSQETLKKLSDSHKGQDHWTGRKHTEESKKKMSEAIKLHPTRYWLGKKRPEIAERSRETLLQLYKSGAFPKQENTKPERQIKRELIKRGYKEGIDFIHQYRFMNKFMCDFCFPQQKLIIEVDGDFWHASPKKYPDGSSLHPHQTKNIRRDKAKNAYIMKVDKGSWTLLRFWESDIKKDVAKCADKIEEVLTENRKV